MYINIKNFLLFCFYLIINTNALANYFVITEFGLIKMQGNKEIKYQKDNGEIPAPYVGYTDKYWVDYDNKRIFKRFSLGKSLAEGPWIILAYDIKGNQLPFVVPNGYDLNLTKNGEIDIVTVTYNKDISNPEDNPFPGEIIGYRNYNAKTLVLKKIKKIDTLIKNDYSIDYFQTLPNINCKVKEKYYGAFNNYGYGVSDVDTSNFEPIFNNNLNIINSEIKLNTPYNSKLCTANGVFLIGTSIKYLDLSDKFGERTNLGKFGNLERCQLQKNIEVMFCFEKKNEIVGLYKIDLKNKSKLLLWTVPKKYNIVRVSLSRTGKKIMLGLVDNAWSRHLAKINFNIIAVIDRDNPKSRIIHTIERCCPIGFYSEE